MKKKLRTSIGDISAVGSTLSDECLRLVRGGTATTHGTVPASIGDYGTTDHAKDWESD